MIPKDGRARRILAGAVTAFASKSVIILTNFLLVPLLLHYLGSERYGIWVILSGAITMYMVFDIGIANTLTNLISESYANDDRPGATAAFATAIYTSAAIAAILGLFAFSIVPAIPWGGVFLVHSAPIAAEAAVGIRVSLLLFLLTLPASLTQKVLGGYQEVHAANGFIMAGTLLGLLGVLEVIHLHGSIPWLVAAYAGGTVVSHIACMIWLCVFHKPWLIPHPGNFDPRLVRGMLRSGLGFFLVQISGLIVFSADNILIGHYLDPAHVTPYSVTWRLVSALSLLQILIFPSLWPAYSEAYARGDFAWLRATYSRVRKGTILILSVGCAAILAFGRLVIRLWAGPPAVPSFSLLALMCVWVSIFSFTLNQSCLMGAASRVNKQAVASVCAAVLNIALSILWVRTLGSVGVLLGTIVSYVLFVVLTQAFEVRQILREKTPRSASPAAPRAPKIDALTNNYE